MCHLDVFDAVRLNADCFDVDKPDFIVFCMCFDCRDFWCAFIFGATASISHMSAFILISNINPDGRFDMVNKRPKQPKLGQPTVAHP